MDLGLKGKSAIICASSRGLGKACAFSLASNGVNVVLNGRNKEVLEETASYISKSFSDIEVDIVSSDVSTDQGREALLEVCPAPDILMTSALNLFPAISNEVRVRVLGSKNRFMMVRPLRVGTFFIARVEISLKESAVSRMVSISFASRSFVVIIS